VLQHRSGRTGRAGRKGISILLVPPSRRRRAEEMLGRARVTATWGNAPSPEEIRRLDTERLLQNPILTEPAGEDDAATADTLLQSHSARTIAAAFVKLYRSQLPAPEEMPDLRPEREAHPHKPSKGKPERHAPRPERREDGGKTAQDRTRVARGGMEGPWFLLNVGRERNADPKWLLPEICRQGEVTKKDVGAIRVFEMETLFQIDPAIAPKFTILVSERKKGGVRISPALDQTGETRARPRERVAQSDVPGEAPPRKPGFHPKKFAG